MNRIVVNFEPGKAAARQQPRRWARILALVGVFILVVIVLAFAGLFFWWRSYQKSPVYSLALLVQAAQRGDTQEMAKLIDDEEIMRNMVGRVSQKTSDRYGLAMNTNVKQQLDRVVSTSAPALKQTIHSEVINEVKELGGDGEPKPFPVLLLMIRSLVTVSTEGDIAKAAAKMSNRTFEMMMRRDGDRWRVIGLNDDRVVERVVDNVMKTLPAIGEVDANSPLFKNPGKPRKRRR
ncbi:MAG: DUF2939 domain-containing protein [Acidobacteria bacterium]|nr:DUF2939 domain-containing protein [Acidobacteriota bacterium]MCA1627747.1 DUF2939 domain-containing protein [Acidobacteriota bacterium]